MGGMGMMGMGGMGMMGGDTNNLSVVGSKDRPLKVACKAIDMRDVDRTANNRLITVLVQEIKGQLVLGKPLFDYNEIKPRELEEMEKLGMEDVSEAKDDEAKSRLKTYMFGLDLVLREPIEL